MFFYIDSAMHIYGRKKLRNTIEVNFMRLLLRYIRLKKKLFFIFNMHFVQKLHFFSVILLSECPFGTTIVELTHNVNKIVQKIY